MQGKLCAQCSMQTVGLIVRRSKGRKSGTREHGYPAPTRPQRAADPQGAGPQEDRAFEAGVNRTYISGVERGVRNPTVLVLSELAQALKVLPARLLESVKR